jgi:hypothetical protein
MTQAKENRAGFPGTKGIYIQRNTWYTREAARRTPEAVFQTTPCGQGVPMEEKTRLYILWTSDNPVTAEKMVFMYAINSMVRGWWEEVSVILWGAPQLLVARDEGIRNKIAEAREAGVHVSACRACADQLGVTETLRDLGIEVLYWGDPLTRILKGGERLLTV